ncbi:DUF4381 domain-containing protein [Moritella marina]|uniref:DUF4381 domain-containing protein n=1 Tax=Moritella marina TaxID=90736 RepID=UPI003703FDC3
MNSLQQLKGLILPQDVSWWPLAYGWYVLMVLVLVVSCIFIDQKRKHYMNNAYRRNALSQLHLLSMQDATQLLSILHHALSHALNDALCHTTAQQVELQKETFLVSLNKGIESVSFNDFDWQLLNQLAFQHPDKVSCNTDEFATLKTKCQQWLQGHHYEHHT